MRGASLTMLHQPTPRTDLVLWAEETVRVVDALGAAAVIVSDPFMAAAPVLADQGVTVLVDRRPAGVRPDRSDRGRRGRRRAAAADLRFDRAAEGRPDHPPQSGVQRRCDVRRRGVRPGHRRHRQLAAAVPRHGHDGLPDRADVLRRRTGQGHADGLPDRHPVVGQAHRQVQGHDDRRAELRLRAAGEAAAQAGRSRGSSTCPRCAGRSRGPSRSSPPWWRTSARPARPSGCVREAILPAYGMAETTVAVSFSAVPSTGSSSTRWTPTCWPCCTGPCPRRRATSAGSRRWGRC